MKSPEKGWKRRFAFAAALSLLTAVGGAQAQNTQLYAFSSGALTIGKGVLQNFAAMDPPIVIPVGFYVVKHPKGNILFDTGNNDKLIEDKNWWPAGLQGLKPAMTPDRSIAVALSQSVATFMIVSPSASAPRRGTDLHPPAPSAPGQQVDDPSSCR